MRFLNLVLKGKMRVVVRFFCVRKKGGVLHPGELAEYRTGIIDETVASVLAGKHPHEKISPVLRWRHTAKHLFLFLWMSRRRQLNRSQRNFWGVRALEVRTWKLYRGGF